MKICYIHIERAGGTTFNSILRNNYPFYIVLTPWELWTNEEKSFIKSNQLKLIQKLIPFLKGIGGHTIRYNENLGKILNEDIFYITFLRNPINRFISHYYYQKYTMGIPWNIDDFINERRFSNFMTKRFGLDDDLDKAISTIEKINFVGITDLFDESLIILKNLLNSKFDIFYEKKNTYFQLNHKKESFSNQVMSNILEVNEKDLILYKYALEKFKKKVFSYGDDFGEKLRIFKDKNQNYRYNRLRKNYILAINIYSKFIQRIINLSIR